MGYLIIKDAGGHAWFHSSPYTSEPEDLVFEAPTILEAIDLFDQSGLLGKAFKAGPEFYPGIIKARVADIKAGGGNSHLLAYLKDYAKQGEEERHNQWLETIFDGVRVDEKQLRVIELLIKNQTPGGLDPSEVAEMQSIYAKIKIPKQKRDELEILKTVIDACTTIGQLRAAVVWLDDELGPIFGQ